MTAGPATADPVGVMRGAGNGSGHVGASNNGTLPDPRSQSTTRRVKVDVWADIMCPWCYLGKRRLESAAASFAAKGPGERREVEIEFHSFQLAPDLPTAVPQTAGAYIQRETGASESDVNAMMHRLVRLGRRVDLDFNWDAVQVTNTLLAHQLLHHAKSLGKQLEAEEALFAAYFTEGRDVGDAEVLGDIAEQIGLDRAGAVRSLAADEHLSAVRDDIARARAWGARAVPFFVMNDGFVLSGAQETTILERSLEHAWASEAVS